MKNFLILLITLTLLNCAAPARLLDKKTFYKETIVSNLPEKASKLYVKANSWMIEAFNYKNHVIEFTDKAENALIGKYLLQTTYINGKYTNYFAKIDIRIKDHTIKLVVKPITNITTSKKDAPTEIRNKIKSLSDSFEKAMNKKEDW
jgi:hypothetical protein